MPQTQLKSQQALGGDGWQLANETWEYVSVDDPTGIFRVNADVTEKYSAGMRIKFTNATNVIYGIITVVGAYSGGYTSITFLHQIDPTDSLALVLMANSAITANYYSNQKAPYGFPVSPLKWSILVTDTTDRSQGSPTSNTWYNLGGVNIVIPIGAWNVSYKAQMHLVTTTVNTRIFTTLSSANNTESDTDFTCYWETPVANQSLWGMAMINKPVSLTTKTTYYVNTKQVSAGTAIYNLNNRMGLFIKAICAYL